MQNIPDFFVMDQAIALFPKFDLAGFPIMPPVGYDAVAAGIFSC
jgi:hypothetical protein